MSIDNLSNDIRKIGKIISQKVRILYDPENIIDEYYQVPLLLDLINKQKQVKIYDSEQNQIFIENSMFGTFCKQISDKIPFFSYKSRENGLIEVIFDKKEYITHFLRRNSLEYFLNDHFIWKYEFKLNNTNISEETTKKDSDFTIKSPYNITSYSKKPVMSSLKTNKDKNMEESSVFLLKSKRLYVLGPLQVGKNDLLHSLKKIDPKIKIRQIGCPFGEITEYHLIKFNEDKYIDALVAFLPHIRVNSHTIALCDAFLNVDILNLNYLFPIKFRICDPVFISTVETKIVQLLNLYLPYEPDSRDMKELKRELTGLFPETLIFTCFTDQNDNQLAYRSNGHVFIECDDISAAKNVFDRIGGIIFRDRPIIATYYPEILFRARILSVFSIR